MNATRPASSTSGPSAKGNAHVLAFPQSGPAADHADDRRILKAAADILLQGEELLGVLSTGIYITKLPVAFNASIGGHYRHCLDHFTSVLRAGEANMVDYDHRERDPRIELDPGFALGLTRQLRAMLERLNPTELAAPVTTRCEVSYDHGKSPVTQSSLGRELAYAIAHGIHHFALISVMARLLEVELPPHFGVAPSTVAHQQAAA
jgi:hypothetical protein